MCRALPSVFDLEEPPKMRRRRTDVQVSATPSLYRDAGDLGLSREPQTLDVLWQEIKTKVSAAFFRTDGDRSGN
jgi:hypothetical protein